MFAEAEDIDDQYYSSLSGVERLRVVIELRSMINPGYEKIKPVVRKRHIHEENEAFFRKRFFWILFGYATSMM